MIYSELAKMLSLPRMEEEITGHLGIPINTKKFKVRNFLDLMRDKIKSFMSRPLIYCRHKLREQTTFRVFFYSTA